MRNTTTFQWICIEGRDCFGYAGIDKKTKISWLKKIPTNGLKITAQMLLNIHSSLFSNNLSI
jgi:hypothetical protein